MESNEKQTRKSHQQLLREFPNLEMYQDNDTNLLLAKIYYQNQHRNKLLQRITNNVIFWFWLIIGIPLIWIAILLFTGVLGTMLR